MEQGIVRLGRVEMTNVLTSLLVHSDSHVTIDEGSDQLTRHIIPLCSCTCKLSNDFAYLPSKHHKEGHHRPASETQFKWRFAGGSMVVQSNSMC